MTNPSLTLLRQIFKRVLLSLLVVGMASLLYFYPFGIDEPRPVRDAEQSQAGSHANKPAVDGVVNSDHLEISIDVGITRQPGGSESKQGNVDNSTANTKRLEIFGRVVDEYNQPIESVLVMENHYLFNTRSDANGRYRLTLEIPRHKTPLLNFLRAGYRADRVGISAEAFDDDSVAELDVTLVESSDSVRLNGWIGNEIGENLPGQKIRILSRGFQGLEPIFRTAISDENGEFALEAVKPDIDYKLEVFSTQKYARYSVEDLTVTRTPARLNITLERLKFIPISGMFVDTENAPVPNFSIDIKNLTTGTHIQKIVSDSSGFFRLDKFPAGKMKFSSRAPEIFNINGLTLAENEYRNLTLIVDRGIHQLTGWVSDQSGIAVERAMVTLDSEILHNGIESISIRSTVTDSTGKFYFDRLGDIEHVITIYAKGFYKNKQTHRFHSPSSEVHISLSRP